MTTTPAPSPIMRHLDPLLVPDGPHRTAAEGIYAVAQVLDEHLLPGAEKAVALRKLLEARDAACRAITEGGLR